jgi:hypothetical protein
MRILQLLLLLLMLVVLMMRLQLLILMMLLQPVQPLQMMNVHAGRLGREIDMRLRVKLQAGRMLLSGRWLEKLNTAQRVGIAIFERECILLWGLQFMLLLVWLLLCECHLMMMQRVHVAERLVVGLELQLLHSKLLLQSAERKQPVG